jgi:hypothetical protein
MKIYYVGLCLAITITLMACATATKISVAWKDPEYQGGVFQRLLVIGVGQNTANSWLFEDEFAKALRARGTMAAAGHRVLPDVDQLSEKDIAKTVKNGHYDAMLMTRIVAVDKKTRYVPPRSYVVPTPYTGTGYYGYYRSSFAVVREPGYTRTDTTLKLETNLYESRSARLIWSGRSDTLDPASVNATIASVIRAVTQRLAQDGLIRK